MKEKLTIDKLKAEARNFCFVESKLKNKFLFGVTDGKAVGTHIEHKFQLVLKLKIRDYNRFVCKWDRLTFRRYIDRHKSIIN